MILIQADDADISSMIAAAKQRTMGALVIFNGIVRDDGIEELEIEAYEEVARKDLEEICADAMAAFGLDSLDILHRIGNLSVGENILIIIAGAGHRTDAFRGCEYTLECIKERAPFWKKEIRKDGSAWVKGNLEHDRDGNPCPQHIPE